MRDSVEIGKIIKSKRESRGIKQTDFADKLGVHKSTLSKYEKGIRKIPMEDIGKIASALDMSIEELLLERKSIPAIPLSTVPIVSKVTAGEPTYSEEDIIGYTYVPDNMFKVGKDLFGLEVSGDSMDKEFKEGDVVIVEKGSIVENGQLGVVMINGYDGTVKRVRYNDNQIILYPESTNPEHLPQVYDKNDEVYIVGRVVSSQKFY